MAKTETKNETNERVNVADSDTIRQRVLDTKNQVDSGYIDLARDLATIYHSAYYRDWGFKTFKQYCESELEFKYGKAATLVKIWDRVGGSGISQERLEEIGWTKLRHMLRAVGDDEDIGDYLDRAENMTLQQIADLVAEKKGTLSGNSDGIKLNLNMDSDQGAIIMEALAASKELLQIENDVVALQMICQDWMEAQGHSPEKISLENHLKYLKSVYGVDLTIQEADDEVPDVDDDSEDSTDETPEETSDDASGGLDLDDLDDLDESDESGGSDDDLDDLDDDSDKKSTSKSKKENDSVGGDDDLDDLFDL